MTQPILPPPIHNYPPKGESKSTRRINRFIALALIIVAVALGVMFYWAAQTEKPITLNQDPFPTRTIRDYPTAGGVVYLTADYCKHTSAVGQLRMSFVSKTRETFLPVTQEGSSLGCHKSELVVLIPEDIEPDTYRIKFSLTYDINPLKQDVQQEFYSEPVTIEASTSTNQLPEGVELEPRNF